MTFEQQLQVGANHLSIHDPVIGKLVQAFGLPTYRPHTDYYQQLIKSIIGQQLSVKAAATIFGRLIELFGHFPTCEELVARDFDELKSVGLSRSKTIYIRDLAAHVLADSLSFEDFNNMSNEQIIESLTNIKGIGVWTVHMFLIFAMGRLDVLAAGDLGVRTALSRLYKIDHVAKNEEILLLAAEHQWHPYESLVCWYAWQSLHNAPN